jgi:hypothetical protein
MKHLNLFAVAAITLSQFASAAEPAALPSHDAWLNVHPGISVDVHPAGKTNQYEINATITDLATGKVLTQPKLVINAGAPGIIQVGSTGLPGLVSVNLSVTVATDGATATYTSEIHSGTEVISSQKASISLSH